MVIIRYLSKELAASIAPFIDSGHAAVVILDYITGVDRKGGCLGLNFSFVNQIQQVTNLFIKYNKQELLGPAPAYLFDIDSAS